MTKIGCRIGEDIARDRDINIIINYFILSKRAPSSTYFKQKYELHLERIECGDDIDLLCEMDLIFYEHESDKAKALQMQR